MDDEVNLENLDSLPDVVSDEDAANGDIPAAQQQVASEADAQPAADEVRVLGFDAAASSGETVGTGRSSSVTTGWRRPPRSAFAQVSGSFGQWAHQAIDAKPT